MEAVCLSFLLTLNFVNLACGQIDWNNFTNEKTERDLTADLLRDYNRRAIPTKNPHVPLVVTTDFRLFAILGVDEQKETICLQIEKHIIWTDEYLVWDPKEYSNITNIVTSTSNIWIPDMEFFNSVNVETLFDVNAQIFANGTVEIFIVQNIDFRCVFDFTEFPFDMQTCPLRYLSWMHPMSKISNTASMRLLDISDFNEDPEWNFHSFDYKDTTNFYDNDIFVLTIKIVRRPGFYISVILIPTFLVVFVSIVGIFTPHGVNERQEKVSFGIASMLTLMVILDVVSRQVPKSGEGLPLLGRFVYIEMIVTVCAILVSVGIILIHERATYKSVEPPRWLCLLTWTEWEPRSWRRDSSVTDRSLTLEYAKMVRILRAIRNDIHEGSEHGDLYVKWQRIFSHIDKAFLLVFLIINFTILFWFFGTNLFYYFWDPLILSGECDAVATKFCRGQSTAES